jgi:hypothetical protein
MHAQNQSVPEAQPGRLPLPVAVAVGAHHADGHTDGGVLFLSFTKHNLIQAPHWIGVGLFGGQGLVNNFHDPFGIHGLISVPLQLCFALGIAPLLSRSGRCPRSTASPRGSTGSGASAGS